jgi:predicted metal-dependent phosphoesterase TrpH
MLKADLHIHTKEDPLDYIHHTAEDIIDHAAKSGFDVLSITLHEKFLFSEDLKKYAEARNILLIPGVEANIDDCHVVVLNAKAEAESLSSFQDLSRYRHAHPDSFILAPHPFYPKGKCLRDKLIEHIQLFDAVDYCHFYFRGVNIFNKKALAVAKKYDKPVIGTSDCHLLFQFNHTYSLIDSEKNVDSVIEALRQNRVELVTEPIPVYHGIKFFMTKTRR